MVSYLSGKKTYIVAAVTFVLGGLQALGVQVPSQVYVALAAAGFASIRAAVSKGV